MPVADQGENQNQEGDDEEARGLEGVDVRLGVAFWRTRFQLPSRAGCRHEDIVAPLEQL